MVAGYGPLPADQIDADGVVKYLRADPGGESWKDEKAIIPVPALEGPYGTKDVRCTFDGKGKMGAQSEGALHVKSQGANYVDLLATWQIKNELIGSGSVHIAETSPADPVRNIDCREKDMDKSLLWSPQYTESLKGFGVIRFLDWSGGNNIEAGKWERFSPVGHQFSGSIEGIRPQDMIALANTMDADPWIPLAYNGDENYHRQYATLVRDTMKPGRRVYVELGNETWNYMFPVTHQVRAEGVAAKLSPDQYQAALFRYGQKSAWAMKIWGEVFAGQMHRLVRVVNVQNGWWSAEQVLSFEDTHKVIDAVAIAPYIQLETASMTLDQVYAELAKASDKAIVEAGLAKKVATTFKKRLIAYEAGQHIVTLDVVFAQQIQRDPRMEGIYKKYIEGWQSQIGDLLVMYSHIGPISKYGSWGLREYAGQPASDAPKWRAVQSYLQK